MVVAPAGQFWMGSDEDEECREDEEGPRRLVTFNEPFAVGRFAVTCSEFRAFLEDTHHRMPDTGEGDDAVSFHYPGFVQGPRHPVVGVLISDARAYCDWLSDRSGYLYRLLSEAEWEYVARAGTDTPFWWGTTISTKWVNCAWSYLASAGPESPYGKLAQGEGIDREGTVPVDEFSPNPWGLYNVHGNVEELVEDDFLDNYAGAPTDGGTRRSEGLWHVGRGGSWGSMPWELRSAARLPVDPLERNVWTGFRVARDLK
jgi:formylglycine-generating enzyme required for sulfatase activity